MTKPYYDKSNGYYKLDVEGKKKYLVEFKGRAA